MGIKSIPMSPTLHISVMRIPKPPFLFFVKKSSAPRKLKVKVSYLHVLANQSIAQNLRNLRKGRKLL